MTVCKKIRVPLKKETKWLVFFGDPGSIYYMREKHIQDVTTTYCKKKFPNEPVPDWIETITRFSIRAKEHGRDCVLFRTTSGKTRFRFALTITLPTAEERKFDKTLKDAVSLFFLMFKERKKNGNKT